MRLEGWKFQKFSTAITKSYHDRGCQFSSIITSLDDKNEFSWWIHQLGNRWRIAPCRSSDTPFWGPEALPERWKVAYLSYTLSYEVETALIWKNSQFAIFSCRVSDAIGSTVRPWLSTLFHNRRCWVTKTSYRHYLIRCWQSLTGRLQSLST